MPPDGADVLDQVRVEGEARIGSQAGDFPGLPVDDAAEYQGQAGAGVDLVVDLAGGYTAPVAAVDGAMSAAVVKVPESAF